MIFLPHGVVIHNKNDAYNYLYSLGFSKLEIQEFLGYLDIDEDKERCLKEEVAEYENDCYDQFEKHRCLINNMLDIANRLESNKETKAELARKIREFCEYWS